MLPRLATHPTLWRTQNVCLRTRFNNVAAFSQAQDTKTNTFTHNVSATLCPRLARDLRRGYTSNKIDQTCRATLSPNKFDVNARFTPHFRTGHATKTQHRGGKTSIELVRQRQAGLINFVARITTPLLWSRHHSKACVSVAQLRHEISAGEDITLVSLHIIT